MITVEIIRKKLIEAIKLSGKSQTELAKELNVTQPTIAQYVSGKIMPSLDTFANLCIILDLDANDMLSIPEEKKDKKLNDTK